MEHLCIRGYTISLQQLHWRRREPIASRSKRPSSASIVCNALSPLLKSIDLDSYRVVHKNSFSHRNLKTYVVAVIAPGSRQCQAAEQELAVLASSLQDQPYVVLATLNAMESREHLAFCTSTLQVKSYPTILLYPEGSPGMLRYKGDKVTASGLVDALNGSFKATGNQRRVKLQMMESTGGREERGSTVRSIESDRRIVAEAASRLRDETGSYWSPGKLFFWSFVALFGISAFVWDRWIGEWWEMKQLAERQAKRRAGQQFDEETTEQDLMTLSYLDAKVAISKTLVQSTGEETKESGLSSNSKPGPA